MSKSLARNPPANLTVTQWTTAVHVGFKETIIVFLLWAYGVCIGATLAMYLLQGFHAWGFRLGAEELHFLGKVTIGDLVGLLMLTVKAVLRK
jgi:hypothetical protein